MGFNSGFKGLNVQPDDGLLEAETCSWLAVIIILYMYIKYNIV